MGRDDKIGKCNGVNFVLDDRGVLNAGHRRGDRVQTVRGATVLPGRGIRECCLEEG